MNKQLMFVKNIVMESGVGLHNPEGNGFTRNIQNDIECYIDDHKTKFGDFTIQNIIDDMTALDLIPNVRNLGIHSYTRNEFYSELIDSLQKHDVHSLPYWYGIIRHLFEGKVERLVNEHDYDELILYRYTSLSQNMLDDIIDACNRSELIMVNSFVSASLNKDLDVFGGMKTNSHDNIRVKLLIHSNRKQENETTNGALFNGNYPLSLQEYSAFPDELEWVFDIGSVFSVENIEYDDVNGYTIILRNQMSIFYLLQHIRRHFIEPIAIPADGNVDKVLSKSETDQLLHNKMHELCDEVVNEIELICNYMDSDKIKQLLMDNMFSFTEMDQRNVESLKQFYKFVNTNYPDFLQK